ncbi:MAG: hypothetical protein IH820_10745 [Bacteroidetes bacterium]|nr:hypothetical protein [Bacteroidota bacterium]
MKNSPTATLTLLLLAAMLVGGCGSTTALQSASPDREITVDGSTEDWQGALTPIEKKNLSLGVLNDGEFLYLALVTSDRQLINQMMIRGLTVWFDAEGGKGKTFGIRFPLGLMASGAQFSPREMQQNPDARRELFEASLAELDILQSEDKSIRFPRQAVPRLHVMAKMNAGTLVYELQIPLRTGETHASAIDAEPGDVIGLGLETPEIDREAMRQGGRGGGGGRGGRGGGGRGGVGGRGGGGRGGRGAPQQQPESLKLWTTVELAADGTTE